MLGAEPSPGRPQPDPASLPLAVPLRRLLHSPSAGSAAHGRCCCAGSAEPRRAGAMIQPHCAPAPSSRAAARSP